MRIQYIYKQLEKRKSVLYAWFEAMHTRIDLILCHKPEKELTSVAAEISEELIRIEQIANRFNRDSELCRLNELAFHRPVQVSNELLAMIRHCIDSYFHTYGYFDITVNSKNKYRDGIKNIVIDNCRSTVRFLHPDIKLDLSGYVKGYALDRTKKLVRDRITDALLNFGNSSVLALGNHPYGKGWKVEANAQHYPGRWPGPVILYDRCLTSSGCSSVTPAHIISPKTGEYVERTDVVSLITSTGAEGEVFSTALFAAPESCREKMIRKFSLEIVC